MEHTFCNASEFRVVLSSKEKINSTIFDAVHFFIEKVKDSVFNTVVENACTYALTQYCTVELNIFLNPN